MFVWCWGSEFPHICRTLSIFAQVNVYNHFALQNIFTNSSLKTIRFLAKIRTSCVDAGFCLGNDRGCCTIFSQCLLLRAFLCTHLVKSREWETTHKYSQAYVRDILTNSAATARSESKTRQVSVAHWESPRTAEGLQRQHAVFPSVSFSSSRIILFACLGAKF